MSPALNGSSSLERFERSNAIEIRNGIVFDFYPGLPHIYVCMYVCMYVYIYVCMYVGMLSVMRCGVGRNVSCAVGDCITSRSAFFQRDVLY